MSEPGLAPPVSNDRARWARRGAAFVATLAIGWAFRCNYLTDWDSWDYAAQAIMRQSSDLLLGRWWFIATMRVAYQAGAGLFGLQRPEAFVAMQIASAVMMAGAVVAGMAWTYRLTRSARAEVIFAAVALLAPTICVYTFSVMTEGMSLLMLSLALWAWEVAKEGPRRRVLWALGAGLAFGVAVDVREPLVLLGAWPVVSCLAERPARRWRLLTAAFAGAALTLAVGVLGAWAWYPWRGMWVLGSGLDVSYFQGIAKWAQQMHRESTQHHVSIGWNLVVLMEYLVANLPAAGVLVVPAVVWAAFRFRKGLWLAVAALPMAGALLMDHTLQVNVRHPLPLIWFLVPVVAAAWDQWTAIAWRGMGILPMRGGAVPAPQNDTGTTGRTALGVIRKRCPSPRTGPDMGETPMPRFAAAVGLVLAGNVVAVAVGWSTIRERYYDFMQAVHEAYVALRQLPDDATIIPGPGTPAAYYLDRLGDKHFDVIASGWAWPEDLDANVAAAFAAGREVYVYWNEDAWNRSVRKSGEWDVLNDTAARYQLGEAIWPFRRLLPKPAASVPASPVRATQSPPDAPPATGPRPRP